MNKKHFVYSFQYLAVLLSLFTFTACEKDQFTAEDALALEEQRARLQAELDEAAKDAEVERMKDLQKWAHTIDSLNAANAGGLVFYSVSVVPGGSTAFANGRYEEVGVNNVTVTASQYGMEQSATTNNGIAVFPEPFRSGEVTVTVDSDVQGYTSAHYTSNLTPDGGVPNDATVFVNNIIPVFENDPAVHGEEDMAMVSGAAFAELNILDGNNVEENAPQGTAFTAVIDTRPGYGFWDEYIAEANGADEGGNGNVNGGTTRSGAIQMIRYENASTRALVEADGSYSMMTAATASGLPLRLNYSEFIAEREYFQFGVSTNNTGGADALDDGDFGPVAKRTLYGPSVTPTDYVTGTFSYAFLTSADVSLRERDAVIQASITSTGQVRTAPLPGTSWSLLRLHDSNNATGSTTVTVTGASLPSGGNLTNFPNSANAFYTGTGNNTALRAGEYLADEATALDISGTEVAPPTVTFNTPTGGTAATGYALLTNPGTDDQNAAVAGNGELRQIIGIVVTDPGSGYSATELPVVTIDRGANGGTGITGTGTIQAPSNTITSARVIDGGFGFHPGSMSLQTPGAWTGWNPVLNTPATITSTGERIGFTYDWEDEDTYTGFTAGGNGGVSIGTVQQITIASGQNFGVWTAAELATLNNNPFRYYDEAANISISDNGAVDLFAITATGGLIGDADWGTGLINGNGGSGDGSWNATLTEYTFGPVSPTGTSRGRGYVFVPTARPIGGQFAAGGGQPAQLLLYVDGYAPSDDVHPIAGAHTAGAFGPNTGNTPPTGGVTPLDPLVPALAGNVVGGLGAIRISSPGSDYTQIPTGIEIQEPTNSLEAEFFTGGSKIDNYLITQNTGNIISNKLSDPSVANTGGSTGSNPAWNGADAVDPTNNSYYAVFDAPAGGGDAAIAIPVFSGTDVVGLEILYPGVGYDATETPNWYLAPVGGDFTATKAVAADDAVIMAYLEPDNLTFTLTDGGLGYALQPDVYVTGGGVNLDDPNAVNPNDFEFRFDNNGTIISMSFTDNTNGVYTAANAAIDPINVVLTLDEQEELLEAWWNGTSNFKGFTNPDGEVVYGTNCDALTSATFEWLDVANLTIQEDVEGFHQDVADFGNANGILFRGGRTAAGGTGADYGFGGGFITAPTVTFSHPFGTGFAMEYVLKPQNGLVDDVVITNGGTGYICLPTNDPSMNPNGEPFRVLGGPDGSTVDADNDGMMDPFEVYSGLQYVRDVHYGTGEVLE